mmetsp:Transcript_15059/g.25898  ORF Transcript_15059/g.25898 Transcript_15059/m.25898 type:complete len:275 (-) Transcript_15059:20-844(-)
MFSLFIVSSLFIHFVNANNNVIVNCETTASNKPIVMEIIPEWSPLGAARFLELVDLGYYNNIPLFRVVPDFLVQFGINADVQVTKKMSALGTIEDDPPKRFPSKEFLRGYLSFAGAGPNSRTYQIFINYKDSGHLGNSPWETAFGKVIEGMEIADSFFSYGDLPPWGKGPDQGKIVTEGEEYLKNFPKLDRLTKCYRVTEENKKPKEVLIHDVDARFAKPDQDKLALDKNDGGADDDGVVMLMGVALCIVLAFVVFCGICAVKNSGNGSTGKFQ